MYRALQISMRRLSSERAPAVIAAVHERARRSIKLRRALLLAQHDERVDLRLRSRADALRVRRACVHEHEEEAAGQRHHGHVGMEDAGDREVNEASRRQRGHRRRRGVASGAGAAMRRGAPAFRATAALHEAGVTEAPARAQLRGRTRAGAHARAGCHASRRACERTEREGNL